MERPDNPLPEQVLSRLADAYGIEREFWDARGIHVQITPATQRKVLESMGVKTGTVEDEAAALDAVQRSVAEATLPPVVVSRQEGAQTVIEIDVPYGVHRVAWHVALEDGTERSGTADAVAPPRGHDEQPERLRVALSGLPWGYHRLSLPELGASTILVVTPGRCWLPDGFAEGNGSWGIAVQLYLLRSEENWGIGDFADLKQLLALSAARGCDVIGLNPLHQMFLDDPEQASPYSPATRLYLNALFIAVPAVPEFVQSRDAQQLVCSDAFKAQLLAARSASHVEYALVAQLKLAALRLSFAEFLSSASEERRQAFAAYGLERGTSLHSSSLFQVLRQHFSAQAPELADWHKWPHDFQDPRSDQVLAFAHEHAGDIAFLDWLQWLADDQLRDAAATAKRLGMSIGLYRDLAVGCDGSGAETWVTPTAFLKGARVGAPPDIHNPAGQNWGLPPFHPKALRDQAYGSFVELIRANMRHAGGLRIDHVMGLQRLYCIPEGEKPPGGAYVGYPIDDLVGILALESQRQRCLVVGEDLGTVPEGFRDRMAAANILSYRVLFFEQDWSKGTFLPPADYPRLALAVTGSHDLPTLGGWWEALDISQKQALGLYPDDNEAASQHRRREQDRKALLEALRAQSLIGDDEPSADEFARAAHSFLARTGAALVVPQLDDILGETDPVNVPGTTTAYPNWRRKYRHTLEALSDGAADWSRLADIPSMRVPTGRHDHSEAGV